MNIEGQYCGVELSMGLADLRLLHGNMRETYFTIDLQNCLLDSFIVNLSCG